MLDELRALIAPDEILIYEGKPDRRCFVYENIFNPMLPIALIWGLIDFTVLGGVLSSPSSTEEYIPLVLFMIPFMLLHLMPVWMYLGGVLFTTKKLRNSAYIITNKAIYTSSGTFNIKIDSKSFTEISSIDMRRGMFDQLFGVGDIVATTKSYNSNGTPAHIYISSIPNYIDVYNIVKELHAENNQNKVYPKSDKFIKEII